MARLFAAIPPIDRRLWWISVLAALTAAAMFYTPGLGNRWSHELGSPHRAGGPLGRGTGFGCPINNNDFLSYIAVRFATYNKTASGLIELRLLSGKNPPQSMSELKSRLIEHTTVVAHQLKDNNFYRWNLHDLIAPHRELFLLITRQIESPDQDRPVTIWFSQNHQTSGPLSYFLKFGADNHITASVIHASINLVVGSDRLPSLGLRLWRQDWPGKALLVGGAIVLGMIVFLLILNRKLWYLVVIGGAASAWLNRFMQDDAFITFIYSRNLADGLGPVWSTGEAVEGYTNFLWMVLLAGPIKLGFNPELWAHVFGLVFYTLGLIVFYRCLRLVAVSGWIALGLLVILAGNYSYSAAAMGGLETSLQSFFNIVLALLILKVDRSPRSITFYLVVSITAALAVLTRPDGSLAAGAAILWAFWRLRQGGGKQYSKYILLVTPFLLIIVIWLAWKLQFYNAVLPNTFHAKADVALNLEAGLAYLGSFYLNYLMFLVYVPIVFIGLPKWIKPIKSQGVLLAVLVLWHAYLIKINGDIMEFRLLAALVPFMLLLFGSAVVQWPRQVQAILAGVLIAASIGHYWWGYAYLPGWVSKPSHLEWNLVDAGGNFSRVGKELGRLFSPGSGVVISTTAAGAIPYYSQLPTIDMHGLNDRLIARRSSFYRSTAHSKRGDADYYLNRHVNLVIASPLIKPSRRSAAADPVELNWFQLEDHPQPSSIRLLGLPLHSGKICLIAYLVPHQAVEQALAEKKLLSLGHFNQDGRRP